MIDKHNKGWVTGADITDALADYGLYPHKDDVYLFVRRYDRDSDGRILYSDFCDAFCPKDGLSASILNKRQAIHLHKGYLRTQYFTKVTRDMYMRVLRTHFSIEESAELLR